MKRILLLTLIFALLLVSAVAQKNAVLDQTQAVVLAEKFVAENGYVRKLLVQKKLTLEAGEKVSDIENILVARLGSVERLAFSAAIKEANGQTVWSIQFRLVQQDYEKQQTEEKRGATTIFRVYDYAREVQMSLDGRKIWMEKNPTTLPVIGFFGDCTDSY